MGSPVGFEETIPILRVFSVEKAKEFYLGFLGFALDWEHRFGDDFPLYMQVSRGHLRLHLSEHHGDACPGSTIFVRMHGIEALQRETGHQELPLSEARNRAGAVECARDGGHRSVRQPHPLQRIPYTRLNSHLLSGTSIQNCDPLPRIERTPIRQPAFSASLRAIASPRPSPPASRPESS